MKELKLPDWKTKKRFSFHFYFIIYTSIIVSVSVAGVVALSAFASEWLELRLKIPSFVTVSIMGLFLGIILSHYVGKFTLSPIKKIRNAMREVSEGNFNVSIDENSRFDEIEDICHAFNMMTKELRSTETIQTDFISNVSHEFKTPLTAIEGYATLLQSGGLDEEEQKEYSEKILFNTRRMNELVKNILLLSKLDNQGIESVKAKFSLDEQIRQEIVASEQKWSEKNLSFDVVMEEIEYYGNGSLLSNVWGNLLGNAIKFSPEGGEIKIELKKEQDYVYFAISDEGEGVKEESKKYLFDKFYQSDTSHKQEGNGLGLALVKKIVDIYAGEVEVFNLEPKGCKFIVRLPLE